MTDGGRAPSGLRAARECSTFYKHHPDGPEASVTEAASGFHRRVPPDSIRADDSRPAQGAVQPRVQAEAVLWENTEE